jgi:hypothetical protein
MRTSMLKLSFALLLCQVHFAQGAADPAQISIQFRAPDILVMTFTRLNEEGKVMIFGPVESAVLGKPQRCWLEALSEAHVQLKSKLPQSLGQRDPAHVPPPPALPRQGRVTKSSPAAGTSRSKWLTKANETRWTFRPPYMGPGGRIQGDMLVKLDLNDWDQCEVHLSDWFDLEPAQKLFVKAVAQLNEHSPRIESSPLEVQIPADYKPRTRNANGNSASAVGTNTMSRAQDKADGAPKPQRMPWAWAVTGIVLVFVSGAVSWRLFRHRI